jgi:pyruvate,water dikinase
MDGDLAGAKAANLARAAHAGLPVLPGFVLTTASFDPGNPGWSGAPMPEAVVAALRAGLDALAGGAPGPLVVRSSSTVEDVGTSSMAGQFRSHLGVAGWDALEAAVRDVLRSSREPVGAGRPAPMAVLVQRQVSARIGGVMFGLDPVTGDRQHLLVEVVPGGPESLVSGAVTAQRFLIGRRGRLIEGPDADAAPLLDARDRRRLARLAARVQDEFAGAQDIEWAMDGDGVLHLLQSRPVTAVAEAAEHAGPLLGPGPFGETFPEPLRPLEEDLWVAPLRLGVESAITLVGAVPRRTLAGSPLVTTVAGRVACDLALLGVSPTPRSPWRWLDPRVPARRLASAWRVGRLRAVLPELSTDICAHVDSDLTGLGPLAELSDAELVELLRRTREYLASVHGHEVLAGALLGDRSASTAAGLALSIVARGRALGLSDHDIVARWPVSLALTAPRIGAPAPLPPVVDGADRAAPAAGGASAGPQPTGAPHGGAAGAGGTARPRTTSTQVAALPAREALRLRARWLQELSARAAAVLGQRLADGMRIPSAESVAHLRLEELEEIVSGWPAPEDLADRRLRPSAPLPTCFLLTAEGRPVRVRLAGSDRPGGRGAAQGRSQGRVVHDPAAVQPGDILVTRTLDPRLAGWLPLLGGIVSETGSVLSHLAILAREYRVPAVVGVHDAVQRYPVGSELVVDGSTGEVLLVAPGAGRSGGEGGR